MTAMEDVTEAPIITGRGGRPVGKRFRDRVYEVIPTQERRPQGITLRELVERMDLDGDPRINLQIISRATFQLVKEYRIGRESVLVAGGRHRWVYWRL